MIKRPLHNIPFLTALHRRFSISYGELKKKLTAIFILECLSFKAVNKNVQIRDLVLQTHPNDQTGKPNFQFDQVLGLGNSSNRLFLGNTAAYFKNRTSRRACFCIYEDIPSYFSRGRIDFPGLRQIQ